MLATFNGDSDLFKKVITGDESWMYGYDIESKGKKNVWCDWGDKRKLETGAVGDIKKGVSELEK